MNRSRKSMIALSAVLTLGLGTIAVEGAPVCERLVKTFKDKRVKNHPPTKKVLAAWKLWGETHPNYKSHPRPKYKVTKEEVIEKVSFACEVPKVPPPPPEITTDFPPVEFPPPQIDLTPPDLPPVELLALNNETPPLPFVPPYSPGVPTDNPAPVPEPSSLLLLCTGGAFLILLVENSRFRSRI